MASPLTSTEKLTEAFSLALEDRSKGYQDLVSNSNVLLKIMKDNGQWKEFSGPTIRERLLYNETGSYVRYSGYQFLNPVPAELINDAEFTPKMAAVSVVMSMEEILKNSGRAQLMDTMELHIEAAEQELQDRFVEDLHSDGTASNQIGGLQLAIPTTTSSGTYGGISRVDNAISSLKYYGAGKSVNVVLEGGIGSAMPSAITYFIDTKGLHFRYHPERNFSKIGGKQTPVNQDAIVQHIGFMGELTLVNPLHMAKLYDSA
jgi:hypothetical protein